MKLDENVYSSLVREILNVGTLTDKVICIIPEWETHGGVKIVPPDQVIIKDYVYYEKYLQQRVRKILLNEGIFKFYAFHHRSSDISRHLDQAEEKALRLIKKNAPESEILDAMYAFIDPHISLLPATKENLEFIKSEKVKFFRMSVLCIDYAFFSNKILYYYLLYLDCFMEKKSWEKAPVAIKPLFELFSDMYIATRFETNSTLQNIIKSSVQKELTSEEYDLASFLSTNHVQNIDTPYFWDHVTHEGFYLGGEDLGVRQNSRKKEDFRFFYSLESLLFYELIQMMNKVRRCKNCNSVLPIKVNNKNFKGVYCQPGFLNFETCNKERTAIRQRKFKKVTS